MSAELISLVSQFHQIVWYMCCYILKSLFKTAIDQLGVCSKYKIRYNYSDIDASKIYIIINIFELSNREYKCMDQCDYLAECNRNPR